LPPGTGDVVPPCLEAVRVDDVLAALRRVLAGAPRAGATP
jgi:hypothetical protein